MAEDRYAQIVAVPDCPSQPRMASLVRFLGSGLLEGQPVFISNHPNAPNAANQIMNFHAIGLL
jgi:hypothetical protein